MALHRHREDNRSHRELRIQAEELIINKKIFKSLVDRDFALLIEIARIIENDADVSLAFHDPVRFRLLRDGITKAHIQGIGHITERSIRAGLREAGIPEPPHRWTKADLQRTRDAFEELAETEKSRPIARENFASFLLQA